MCRRRFNFGHTFSFDTSDRVLTCVHFSRDRMPVCSFPLCGNVIPTLRGFDACPKRCRCGCPVPKVSGSGMAIRAFSVGDGMAHGVSLPLSTSNCVPHVGFASSRGTLTVVALGHRRGHFSLCFTGPQDALYGLVMHSRTPRCVGRRTCSGVIFCPGGFIIVDRGSNCGRLCLCADKKGLIGRVAGKGFRIGSFLK